MPRGEKKPVGAERVSQNGYVYVKMSDGSWKLKHHVVIEEKLGRSIDTDTERVLFNDRDRKNFDPDNLIVTAKKGVTKETRRAQLEARRDEIEAQLADLEEGEPVAS